MFGKNYKRVSLVPRKTAHGNQTQNGHILQAGLPENCLILTNHRTKHGRYKIIYSSVMDFLLRMDP